MAEFTEFYNHPSPVSPENREREAGQRLLQPEGEVLKGSQKQERGETSLTA